MAHPPLRSGRLLDQLRERIRYAHYSLRTEKTHVYWARFFTAYYFLHFLVVMPIVGVLETPRPMPRSISEAVLGGAGGTPHGATAAPERR